MRAAIGAGPGAGATHSSDVWRGVSVVKPNELEAEVLTGIAVTDRSSCGAGGALVSGTWCRYRHDHSGRARRHRHRS